MSRYRIKLPEENIEILSGINTVLYHFYREGTSKTQYTRKYSFAKFTRWVANELFVDVDEMLDSGAAYVLLVQCQREANLMLEAYMRSMEKEGLTAKTINARVSDVISLIKMARRHGLVSWRVDIKRKRVKKFTSMNEGPTLDEVKLAIEFLNKIISGEVATHNSILHRHRAVRDKAVFSLFIPLALRPFEVAALTLNHIDMSKRKITIRGKSRDEDETLSMPPQTHAALQCWLEVRKRRPGPLFTEVSVRGMGKTGLSDVRLSSIITCLSKKTGIYFTPRGLRHTAITEVMRLIQEMGYSIEEGLKYSRHKSLEVLLVYLDRIENRQGEFASALGAKLDGLL